MARTSTEIIPGFSRHSDKYAHDVAFMAAEEALFDLDLARKRGRLSYRYYFQAVTGRDR
jgi:hypothetical protein